MEFIKQHKLEIIVVLTSFLLVGAFIAWIKLINKDKDDSLNEEEVPYVDVSDVNNVDAVESRLDYKMKISQGYLLTYTTNKSGIWYMSSAYVSKIKVDGTIAYITVANKEKTHSIVLEIESNKVNVKKGDLVNFVGTIDLETTNIELAKLSKDTINYSNVTEMEFTKLVDNIKLVKDNVFVINGYMITDKDRFKLFESKSSYEEDSSVGRYFTITWKDKFNYTGNANVTLECKINGTYKLKDCVLVE
jgi:hypothetical protein